MAEPSDNIDGINESQEPESEIQTEDENGQMVDVTESYPVGIGGWLLLQAINLVLSGVITVIQIATLFMQLFKSLNSESTISKLIELLGKSVFMYILIRAAVFFFEKKASAPYWMIIMIYANIFLCALIIVVAICVGESGYASEKGIDFLFALVYGAIWIQYFKVSKRVQATFVND
jgi:hypothetical protein